MSIDELPQEFLVENSSINVEFLENKTGKITAGTYLVCIAEIVYSVNEIGAGALVAKN